MSFILDALRKSETERQQQASAEFATVPASSGGSGVPRWLWALGLLLAVNLAVLIGLWLRPDVATKVAPTEAPPTETLAAEAAPAEAAPAESFASRVEAARQNAPAEEEAAVDEPVEEPPVARVTIEPSTALTLPTYQEVQARGLIDTTPLHVDIHVYSEIADDRFVFVNMAKQTEGSRLREGPLVEEIVPEGVILEMNGTRFLLPRD